MKLKERQIEQAIKDIYDLTPEEIIQEKDITAKEVYKQMSGEERSDIREHIYLTNNN